MAARETRWWSGASVWGLVIASLVLTWSDGAQAQPLGDRGPLGDGAQCVGVAINDADTVVGHCLTSAAEGGHVVAVRWLAGGGPTLLPTLAAGKGCSVDDLNNAGAIAGQCDDAANEAQAVRWPAAGGAPEVLQPFAALLGLLTDVEAQALRVNASGAIIGLSLNSEGHPRAVVWLGGSTLATMLPEPEGLLGGVLGCTPVRINDGAGTGSAIAGDCEISDAGETHRIAVRWRGNGAGGYTVTALSDLAFGNERCTVVAINAAGGIAGTCEDVNGDATAVRWSANDVDPLPYLESAQSEAVAILEDGRVVGNELTPDGFSRAFLWDVNADTVTPFGILPGGHWCTAHEANTQPLVVLTCDAATGHAHAAAWSPSSALVDLGTLGGHASEGVDVSANGPLLASAQTPEAYVRAATTTAAVLALGGAARPRGERDVAPGAFKAGVESTQPVTVVAPGGKTRGDASTSGGVNALRGGAQASRLRGCALGGGAAHLGRKLYRHRRSWKTASAGCVA